eukprot:7932872-Lingulodinium_polyedra.AAC.1
MDHRQSVRGGKEGGGARWPAAILGKTRAWFNVPGRCLSGMCTRCVASLRMTWISARLGQFQV